MQGDAPVLEYRAPGQAPGGGGDPIPEDGPAPDGENPEPQGGPAPAGGGPVPQGGPAPKGGEPVPQAALDNTQIATLLTNLTGALDGMQTQMGNLADAISMMPGGDPLTETRKPVTDLFANNDPFDLSTRSGLSAMDKMEEKLDVEWNGETQGFPAFILELEIRGRACHWNDATSGILKVSGHHLFTKFAQITNKDITQANTDRTNPRARQNAQALFRCLRKSITGSLKETIFGQIGNIPQDEDGVALFKQMAKYSTVSSLQLAIATTTDIQNLCPAELDFSISRINSRLVALFGLVTTQNTALDDSAKLQYTLTVYRKIRQPDAWAQWTRNQVDAVDSGTLKDCQTLMNNAAIKYAKIVQDDPERKFRGSLNTVAEDIIAMTAKAIQNAKKRPAQGNQKESNKKKKPAAPALPKFAKWTNKEASEGGDPYVVGDTRTHNNTTWYFCDCPMHRDKVHWHTWPAEECKTRARWLKKQQAGAKDKAIANNAEVPGHETAEHATDTPTDVTDDATPPGANFDDPKALLAHALTLKMDDVSKDTIADLISSL